MNIIFILMLILSLSIMATSHPISILIAILIQTTLICCYMWLMIKTSWLSFILFLIFLGGLMVLFVYIVSLASNETIQLYFKQIQALFLLTTLITFLSFTSMFFDGSCLHFLTSLSSSAVMIFSSELITPTISIMTYLLITLIAAIKISSKVEGPLRNCV